ncbi:Filamentous hemagglutinin outer membrane protein [Sulfitobacter noctilucae]|nr:Filamentous hemagglutinin outer membrane protein [Sulfitobacter noctilucae]
MALVLGTALTPVLAQTQSLPIGGSVVAGDAQISTPGAGAMTINQSSDRAVINWQDFSIGAGGRVDINQPTANSAILNRVTGDTTSQIHGQLNANGRVFVVNPNGIFIGQTGSVNTGSFVASTLGVRTDRFMTGELVFEGDGASATVSNAGNIEVVTGGYAALIGGKVKNSGTIHAPLGFVGLGSGERITLDLAGDGFLQVAIPTESGDDTLDALIENSGTIQANGGTVQISAATARNAARHAINMSGVVEARTVSGRNGRVTLGGGSGGKVTVSGKIKTKTRRPAIQVTQSRRPALRPARGGDITITGQNIALEGATIDASGADGGGTIRIGGEYQGGPGLMTADTLSVDEATVIKADAYFTGDGGRVIAWSDLRTDFGGDISARGGATGGNGGFAEVSGMINLTMRGTADLRAPNGISGMLLLDPTNIEIVDVDPGTNQLLNTFVNNQLGLGDFTIDTSTYFPDESELGTISVDAPINWNSANALRLNADNAIIVNETITSTNGPMRFDADGNVDILAPISIGDDFVVTGSDITIGADVTNDNELSFIATGTLNIGQFGNPISINSSGATLAFGAGSDIEMFPDSEVVSSFGDLEFTAGDVIIIEDLTTTDGDIVLSPNTDMVAGGFDLAILGEVTTDTGNITINAENLVEFEGPLSAPGGRLAINVNGAFPDIEVSTGAAIDVDEFVLSGGNWFQVDPNLASFDANNFVLQDGVSFLRVLGGTGQNSPIIDPYLIGDIYGLQGLSTLTFDVVELANDIDASVTSTWESLAPLTNGFRNSGFVPFFFNDDIDGQGYDITGLFVRQYPAAGGGNAGLFSAVGDNARITNFSILNADVAGDNVGILAGENGGFTQGIEVTGTVVTYGENGGGLNGLMPFGITRDSSADVDVSDAVDPSEGVSGNPVGLVNLGGLVGLNDGDIISSKSTGSVTITAAAEGFAGGLVGRNEDIIQDVYSSASVTADSSDPSAEATIGGLVGDNQPGGTIVNGLATGAVTLAPGCCGGFGIANGLVGEDDGSSDQSILSSFWNRETTGQLLSGQDGEMLGSTNAMGQFEGAFSETTASLNDAFNFTFAAFVSGWDFANTWSYPLDGLDHARLYSVDPVISAVSTVFPNPVFTYNGTVNQVLAEAINNGGTGDFFFGPVGDSGAPPIASVPIILSGPNVGPQTFTFPTAFTSNLGQAYTVRSLPTDATVNPAPLTVTVNDTQKQFGNQLAFSDVNISTETLFGSDAITSADVVSAGNETDTPISEEEYFLSLTNLAGPGLTNYSVSVIPGRLRVIPRDVNVIINDATKTYGEELTFSGDEFTSTGLINGDILTSLNITSEGAAATAQVEGSPFDILGTEPVGTGLQNYTINIVPGILTITPAPLTITADDQTKAAGASFTFAGTEFTVEGLLNDDTVTSATLNSVAIDPDTPITGDTGIAILITDPQGSGLDNYTVTLVNGVFIVAPGNLTITANDQTKVYGDTFAFDGSEFTVVGLAEGDSVDSVTLTSDGADANAQVADGPFLITPSDAVGTGLEKYTLVFADGSFTVTPAPLTVSADDQSKPQGTAFVFSGTEFTTAGLLNADTVDSAILSSEGADATAQADDSPFAITIGDVSGSGLTNYDIATVDGAFTVTQTIIPPVINPNPSGGPSINNPPDRINISFPDASGTPGGIQSRPGGAGPQQSLPDAEATFEAVDDISDSLELAVQSCGSADQDFANYMACLSESLDTYSNALDEIANDLPSGLETVSATIRTARDAVDAAAARATRRLATATTDAQRRAIQRDAVNEARGAIDTAKTEIRKAISLIRADDPEVAAVQRQTGARIVQAFDAVDSSLARAVDL